MQKFILKHRRSPGDIVVMTALPRDIAMQHPGKYQIGVDTSFSGLWENNPYVTKLDKKDKTVKVIDLDYGEGIRKQRQETVHFLTYFHKDFTKKTGIPVSLGLPYGDLHLTAQERGAYQIKSRYWVINAGGKSDATVKVWWTKYFQETADLLKQHGIEVVQVGATEKDHWHPKLSNVISLVGRTNLRQLMAIIANADGVISGITAVMHMAAALQRPCVVTAGGREAWYWEAYVRENAGLGGLHIAEKLAVPHRYLHTIGLLDCCRYCGCWKNKVVPTGKDKLICLKPIKGATQTVPACMDMITPEMVEQAVLSYYYDGTLPDIAETPLNRDTRALWEAHEHV
jgi:ADP-heptose:LPS heptosyltransferase